MTHRLVAGVGLSVLTAFLAIGCGEGSSVTFICQRGARAASGAVQFLADANYTATDAGAAEKSCIQDTQKGLSSTLTAECSCSPKGSPTAP